MSDDLHLTKISDFIVEEICPYPRLDEFRALEQRVAKLEDDVRRLCEILLDLDDETG